MKIPMSLLPLWHVAINEHHKFVMHGLRVEPADGGMLRLVACDGRKLIVAEFPGVMIPQGFTSGLIPRGLCRAATQVGVCRGEADLEFDEKLVNLVVPTAEGRVELTAPEPEGKYPPWQTALEKAQRPILEVPDDQLGSAVPVKLGVNVFLGLLQSLSEMGLETIDLWLPVTQKKVESGVPFRAYDDDRIMVVTGAIMRIDGESAPLIPPKPKE